MTTVVDLLPEEVFIEAEPTSPSMFSPKDSSDSLPESGGAPQEYPGSNVVNEMVHTERKFVQDLETMQVRTDSIVRVIPSEQFFPPSNMPPSSS